MVVVHPFLHRVTKQDENSNEGRTFEIDWSPSNHRKEAVKVSDRGSDCDQGIHVGIMVFEGRPGTGPIWQSRHQHNQGGGDQSYQL
ncbi:MAG: hypothetical protein ACLSH6_02295 [Limosilactobacillus pontis]